MHYHLSEWDFLRKCWQRFGWFGSDWRRSSWCFDTLVLSAETNSQHFSLVLHFCRAICSGNSPLIDVNPFETVIFLFFLKNPKDSIKVCAQLVVRWLFGSLVDKQFSIDRIKLRRTQVIQRTTHKSEASKKCKNTIRIWWAQKNERETSPETKGEHFSVSLRRAGRFHV